MSANQTGNTELYADGTEASPSVQIGRWDTGFYVVRGSTGAPAALRMVVAGVALGGVSSGSAPTDSVAATGTLTSNNTNVSAGATVTIGSKTYTFRAALTPIEGEVLIGADADASLLNLIRAINHSGTAGTDYSATAAHPTVTAATSVTSHAFAVTAATAGTAGNAIATTETSVTLSFGAATLTGGVDGAAGVVGELRVAGGSLYVCMAASGTTSTGTWKKVTIGSL